jgi:2,3-bisphosphoglycerate-dependent phosphoglycerate mutase
MTRLILIRHSETEWNIDGRYQGHCDSPVTGQGRRQIESVAALFVGRKPDALYSSDLPRALAMAEAIGQAAGLPVIVDQRLREKNFGMIEGMNHAEFEAHHPEEYAIFRACGPDDPIPGGESTRRRYELNVDAIEEIAARHDGGEAALVVHGGVLENIFRHVCGIPLGGPKVCSIFNASISSIVRPKAHWSIETWGCTAHLGETPLDGRAKF